MTGVLVHEWLARTGGSENVFEKLIAMFPDAERHALWNASGGRFQDVRETWLARTPLRHSKAAALPLMPAAWRSLHTSSAPDWVLISSHLFAHHAKFKNLPDSTLTFVYAHTPARYIWVPELDGRGKSCAARMVGAALKPLDRRSAQRHTAIAANSRFVADRISSTWERESTVIYPPVDVADFAATPSLSGRDLQVFESLPAQFLLGVSRFVPYKRLEAAIHAGRAANLPVVLAGRGPDESRLRALAEEVHPGGVTFVLQPSFDLLRVLYRQALALVFAPIEDFGIIPVEAMAAGTPVIANAIGGAAESVVDGVTGVHVHDWNRAELEDAVRRAVATSRADCERRAQLFSPTTFEAGIRAWMASEGAV